MARADRREGKRRSQEVQAEDVRESLVMRFPLHQMTQVGALHIGQALYLGGQTSSWRSRRAHHHAQAPKLKKRRILLCPSPPNSPPRRYEPWTLHQPLRLRLRPVSSHAVDWD